MFVTKKSYSIQPTEQTGYLVMRTVMDLLNLGASGAAKRLKITKFVFFHLTPVVTTLEKPAFE